MTSRMTRWVIVALAALSPSVAAQSAPDQPCAACLVLSLTPGQTVLAAEPLNGLEVVVRLGDPASTEAAAAALESILRAGGRPGLVLGLAAAPPSDLLDRAHRLIVDVQGETPGEDLAFRLKTRLTGLRGASGAALVGILGPPATVDALLAGDLAAYVDFVARAGGPAPPYPARPAGLRSAAISAPSSPGGAARAPAVERWLIEVPADALAARQLVTDVSRAAPLLSAGLIAGGTSSVSCGGARASSYLDPESLDTIAVARGCAGRPLEVAPAAPGVERIELSGGDTLVRVPAAQGQFAEGVEVAGTRTLTVGEIVARHQAAAARQRREVQRLISTGTMTLTFEAPGFPAPMAISSTAVIYAAPDRVEIEQRDVRVNGIAFRGAGIPRLPLIEPERVASPPLEITLTDVYRYRLEGQDRAAGVLCHVVAFEPVGKEGSLFAGRVWIAADSFAMVKVSAVQTGLRGPIVSSEQTDEFRREGDATWLLARSEIRQIYEGAGHRTPIHRVLAVGRHEINPAGFEARRAAAYASSSIMLRDTAEGFRYLTREKADAPGDPRTTEPAVAGRADRIRTLALGVIIDPNISKPLPFAGLSYVDFNLFDTGTQLNGFFGGSYAQVAVSVPSLGGTRWQLAGRAFGIASSYNDRAFVQGREIYRANISQRPAHASVWALHPLTTRLTVRGGYEFDYTHYGRADSTAPSFAVPASQAAHAVRLAIEGQRSGWAGSLWWSGARRAGWRAWGETAPGEPVGGLESFEPGQEDYQRFGATLSRSFVASPRLVGRVEAAGMAGRDLDRFSRFTFGSFDNRLRGYPSALIRYDRGGVLRAAGAWAAGRVLRLDGFVDTAFVRDPAFGPAAKSYTGVGAAAEVPAPFGTLLAVEWGYGFQGLNSDGRRGTQVVRVSGYKMF